MTCCTHSHVYARGSIEYVEVELTSEVVLDAQVVEFSFDGTWLPAGWVGTPGTVRVARMLMDFGDLYRGTYDLRVRITDSPEVPIIFAGQVVVK